MRRRHTECAYYLLLFGKDAADDAALVGFGHFGEVGLLHGDELNEGGGHFVGGFFAEGDAAGRIAGVANVGGGIVVEGFEHDLGAGGQTDGGLALIEALPVEVPVVDPDQLERLAGGRNGGDAEIAADEVHVGKEGEHFHLDGDAEFVAGAESGFARRNVDLVVEQHDIDHRAARRLVGQEKADGRLLDLGLAAGMQVKLQDEVGAVFPGHGNAVGQGAGFAAGGPGGHAAGKEAAGNVQAALKAGERIGFVVFASFAGGVGREQGVMDDAAVAGTIFEGLDVLAGGNFEVEDEIAIDIGPVGGNGIGLGHREDDVGLAERPAVVEFWGRRADRRRRLRPCLG